MSTPLAVKRRRLNHASSVLSKPFVSPLKKTTSTAAAAADQTTTAPLPAGNKLVRTSQYTPSTLAHTIQCANSSSPQHQEPPRTASTKGPAPAPKPQHRRPLALSQKGTDREVQAAQRALTALELQLRTCKNEIETLRQAAQILSHPDRESDLADLATKWRQATQQAAEELFGTVKERVCRMGGVAAWRETERRKFERSNGIGEFPVEAEPEDDADCEFDSQGEELPEAEQEFRKREKRRVRRERDEAADEGGEMDERKGDGKVQAWQEGGEDDDEFTMDMMLRSLNIELRVIGYDKHSQRWVS